MIQNGNPSFKMSAYKRVQTFFFFFGEKEGHFNCTIGMIGSMIHGVAISYYSLENKLQNIGHEDCLVFTQESSSSDTICSISFLPEIQSFI